MNTLHELISDIERKRMKFSLDDYKEEELYSVFGVTLENAREAVAFDLGEVDFIRGIDGEVPRMPYETTWFEMSDILIDTKESIKLSALVVETKGDDPIHSAAFFYRKKHEKRWTFIGQGDFKLFGSTTKQGYERWMDGSLKIPCRVIMGNVYRGCLAMECVNVVRVEQKPSSLRKTMAARKNKVPLISTWTLHLKQESRQKEDRGGSHASPRVHLRRGHVRQYAPGKKTWVQACIVRGKGAGMIFKDYAMQYAET